MVVSLNVHLYPTVMMKPPFIPTSKLEDIFPSFNCGPKKSGQGLIVTIRFLFKFPKPIPNLPVKKVGNA